MVVVWFVDHTPMLLYGCDGSVDHIDASSMVVAVHLNHTEALSMVVAVHLNHTEALSMVVMVLLITLKHCPWL
jgi:hypothetical protein